MKTGWILCDQGKTGTYRQCLALANLLEKESGFQFIHKPIRLNHLWRYLPPHFAKWKKSPQTMQSDLIYPYPDLIIAAGRQAVTAAMAFRKHSFTVILQHPKINPAVFDLVIPPYHDNLKGQNVISTLGALHPIRPKILEDLRFEKTSFYANLQSPKITVLVGGDNKYYRYTESFVKAFAEQLSDMITKSKKYRGGSLLITPSRRTRPEIILELEKGLKGVSYQLWNGEGDNPYMDYLAISDAIVVTGDSISMMSEACLMGKPVYIAEVPIQNKKFKQFISDLYVKDHAALFRKELKSEGFQPLNELDRIGEQILRLLPHDS